MNEDGATLRLTRCPESVWLGPRMQASATRSPRGPTMDALVGAGGWGYFSGGLEAYARGFRFVEVNVSFYRRIPEATARRWRSRVPDDFVFAIKSNQAITHTDRLRASARARAAFSNERWIACILRSPFLILETPPRLRFEAAQVLGLREMAGMSVDGLHLGLEARAYRGQKPLPEALRIVN